MMNSLSYGAILPQPGPSTKRRLRLIFENAGLCYYVLTMPSTMEFDGLIFTLLGEEATITAGQGKHYEIDGRHLAAFRVGERVFVTDYRCPHLGRPLTMGTPAADCTLTCPVHAWKFSLETGANTDRHQADLKVFPVRQENGLVYVRLDA